MGKFQNYSCPICSDRGKLFVKERKGKYLFDSRGERSGHYDYFLCPICDILFGHQVLDENALEVGYSKALQQESVNAAGTYKKILDKLKLSKDCKILDIGCGDGSFLQLLQKDGFSNLTGIDPGAPTTFGPIKFYRKSFTKDVFSSKFDLICSFMAMEHMINPLEVLKNCFHLLNKQGHLLLAFHDFRYFFNYLFRKYSPIYDHQHLQLFSRTGAKNLVTKAGFKMLKIRGFSNHYPISYWLRFLGIDTKMNLKVGLNVGNFYLLAIADI